MLSIAKSPLPRNTPKIALALGATLFALLLIEVALRILALATDSPWKRVAQGEIELPPKGMPAQLGQCIRAVENPRIVYEMRPGLDVVFEGHTLKTNALGFRGPPVDMPKPPDRRRIVGIGDSTMFGWGVDAEEAYLSRLVEMLNAAHAIRWDAVNMAVPGYNTVMQVEVLREKGLALQPDLVLVNYDATNDWELPNFIHEAPRPFSLTTSFLLRALRPLFGAPRLADRLAPAPRAGDGSHMQGDPDRVPAAYREMVGSQAWARAMDALKEMAEIHDFDVIVVSIWMPQQIVRDTCRKLGFPLIESWEAWRRHAASLAEQDPLVSWRNSPSDLHPNPQAHRVVAQAILQAMRQTSPPPFVEAQSTD